MTITSTDDLALALEAVSEFVRVADPTGEGRRAARVVPADKVSKKSYVDYMREVMEECTRRITESIERVRLHVEALHAQVQRMIKQIAHRGHGRATGKNKMSTKKSAKSSGSSGGDGGGDGEGDGPHQPHPKKKYRSCRNRRTSSKRPPSLSSGAIASTSPPKSPPPTPQHGQGLTVFYVLVMLLIVIVLYAFGEPDKAWAVLGPLTGAMIACVKPPK